MRRRTARMPSSHERLEVLGDLLGRSGMETDQGQAEVEGHVGVGLTQADELAELALQGVGHHADEGTRHPEGRLGHADTGLLIVARQEGRKDALTRELQRHAALQVQAAHHADHLLQSVIQFASITTGRDSLSDVGLDHGPL